MAERTAILRDVEFGIHPDMGVLSLTFATYISECEAAGQSIFDLKQIEQMLKDAKATAPKELNGKPCWVDVSSGMIVFKKMWKL
jgi:hypothetical protein